MSTTDASETVAVILSDSMVKVLDVFRDIFQNFELDDEFLLDGFGDHGSLNHLFSNLLAHAEDETVAAVLLIYRTCVSKQTRPFQFKALGSSLASSDEIALLILISASQQGRFGLSGEAALRLGCSESLTALRAAYQFGSWLTDVGIDVGSIDPRLMQQSSVEFADRMISRQMEQLEFSTPASRLTEDYARLVRG